MDQGGEQPSIETRISALERGQRMLAADFVKLNNSVDENTGALREFIALGQSLKFGIKFLGIIENTAVWITKVALAFGTIIAIWKYIVIETITRARS